MAVVPPMQQNKNILVETGVTVEQHSNCIANDLGVSNAIKKNSFTSKFITLLSGAAIGQFITVLASPILSRLYTPEQFGYFGIFMAIFAVLSVFVTARYELAIPLPQTHKTAAQIVYLAIFVALVVTTVLFILIASYSIYSSKAINAYWLILPCILFFGSLQSFSLWHNRNNNFKVLAMSRLTQNTSMTVCQAILAKLTLYGLEIGFTIGILVALIYSGLQSKITKRYSYNRKKLNILAKKYQLLPKYNIAPAMLDAIAHQIPMFFIFWYYAGDLAGYYFLATKVLAVPINFLVVIVGHIYLNEMSVLYRADKSKIATYVKSKAKNCLYLALPICLVMFIWGPLLFALCFGSEWYISGEIARFLIFSVAIRFIVAPLSSYFIAAHQMKIASLWQVLNFLCVLAISIFCSGFDLTQLVILYVVSDIVVYGIYYLMILYGIAQLPKKVVVR